MTDSLHMVRMCLDMPSLMRGLEQERSIRHPLDVGYLIHSRLGRIFGADSPKPFALIGESGRQVQVLAYSPFPAAELQSRAPGLTGDDAGAALDWRRFDSRQMPSTFEGGRRLSFRVRACPVVRKASAGRQLRARAEVDAFLAAVDRVGTDESVDREAVYLQWLAQQLRGASIVRVGLQAFRRVRLVRFDTRRQRAGLERPDAEFRGELEVTDPEAFGNTVRRGVGRHRAFGFGMLLLAARDRC